MLISLKVNEKCIILKSKKMNLEKLNLVELNAQEVQETEGGFLPLAIVVAFYLLHPLATHKAY